MGKLSERPLRFAPSCLQLAVSIRTYLQGSNLKWDGVLRFLIEQCESNKLFKLCI